MAERRAYERLGVIGEARFSCPAGTGTVFLRKGRLENISFGGFTASLEDAVEFDAQVDFGLNIASAAEAICGKGIIRHTTGCPRYNRTFFIVGVEFTDIDRDLLTYLLKRIQTRAAQERRQNGQGPAASFIPY